MTRVQTEYKPYVLPCKHNSPYNSYFIAVGRCDHHQSGAASAAVIATTTAAAAATASARRGASTAVCSDTATGRVYQLLVLENIGGYSMHNSEFGVE